MNLRTLLMLIVVSNNMSYGINSPIGPHEPIDTGRATQHMTRPETDDRDGARPQPIMPGHIFFTTIWGKIILAFGATTLATSFYIGAYEFFNHK